MRCGAALLAACGAALRGADAACADGRTFEATSPGGATQCFHGGDFSFMHRVGKVKKLVFELEGGGACWNAATCGVGACTESVNKQGKVNSLNKGGGIHDCDNSKNVFADWYYVFVPYCTCDLHAGMNDMKYTINTVHHNGHNNMMSALNWTLANFPTDMETVTTVGCSAGSVGALIDYAFVANEYPNAQRSAFGDSYIGVFSESQWNKCFDHWKIQLPTFVPGVSVDTIGKWYDGVTCDLMQLAEKWLPTQTVGWYTSNADAVQTSFYAAGMGNPLAWTKTMRNLTQCYTSQTKTVHTFIAKGDAHCRSQDSGYYSVTADGTSLSEWVADIANGAKSIANPDCVADGECSALAVPAPAPSYKCTDGQCVAAADGFPLVTCQLACQ